MDQESLRPVLTEESSKESFDFYMGRPYIGEDLRTRLLAADALIIPNEGYGERTELVYFPSGTSDLYQFLADKNIEGLKIEICIEDDDYKEIALHYDWLSIAGFVVTALVAPLVVELIADYIKEHLGKRVPETNVKSKLIVLEEKGGRNIIYTYEGPASEYQKIMSDAISKRSEPVVPADAHGKKKAKQRRHRKKR
jgi:hypothetical protein